LAGIKVLAAAPNLSELDSDNPTPGPPRPLGQDAVRRIEGVPGVRSVIPVLTTPELVIPPAPPVRPGTIAVARDRPATPTPSPAVPFYPRPFVDDVVGVDLTRAPDLPITLIAGRLPASRSLTEIAVSEGYLNRLNV